MSSVDQRVVQMKFDNGKFEQNAKTTLSTLDKLKEKLSFKKTGDGLDDLNGKLSKFNAALGAIDLTGIASAADSINERFSAMGTFTTRIIENLADTAYRVGQKVVGYIATPISNAMDQLTSGGWQRAGTIEQAKFTMKNLGYSWEDLFPIMDESVANTAYGLDQAGQLTAKLLASGVKDGDTLLMTLKAVAGTAATFGASYDQIGDIMQDAMSKGVAMGDEFARLEAIGVPAADLLAEAWGVTAAEIRDMASKRQIDALQLMAVLFDKYGESAAKANETFEGAYSNFNFAFKKIGAKVSEPLREDLRDVLNVLRGIINGIGDALQPVIDLINNKLRSAATWLVNKLGGKDAQQLLEIWGEDGFAQGIEEMAKSLRKTWGETLAPIFDNIAKGLSNLWDAAGSVLKPLAAAFGAVFPPATQQDWINATNKFANFTAKLKLSDDQAKAVKATFVKLFSAIKLVGTIIGNAVTSIKSFVTEMMRSEDPVAFLAQKLSDMTGIKFEVLNGALQTLASIIGSVKKAVGDAANWIYDFLVKVAQGESPIGLIIDQIERLTGIDLSGVGTFLKNIAGGISDLFYKLMNVKLDLSIFDKIKEKTKDLKEHLNFDKIKFDPLGALKQSFEDAKTAVLNFNPIEWIKTVFEKVVSAITNFKPFKNIATAVRHAFTKMGDAGMSAFQDLKRRFSSLTFDDIFKILQGGATTAILINFNKFVKNLSSPIKALTSLLGDKENGIAGIAGSISSTFGALGDALKSFFGKDKDSIIGQISVKDVLKIAVAIGILAASVILLGSMDATGVATGILAISGLLYAVKKFMDSLGGDADEIKGMKKASTIMLKVAVAVLLLASAVKKLASLEPEHLIAGVLGLAAVMYMAVKAVEYLSENVDSVIKSAAGMILMAVAIRVLAGAVKSLGKLNTDQLVTGMLGLFMVLVGMAAFITFVDFDKIGLKASASMILMAAAIRILAGAVKSLSKLSWEQLAVGLIGVGVLLAELGVFMSLIDASGMLAASAAMILMAVALKGVSKVVTTFAKTDKIGQGLTALIVTLLAVGVALNMLKGTIGGAAALLVLSAAMLLLLPSLVALSLLPLEGLISALVGLAGALLILGVGGLALSTIAVPMLIAAGAIAALGVALTLVGAGLVLIASSKAISAVPKTMKGIHKGFNSITRGIDEVVKKIQQSGPTLGESLRAFMQSFFDTLTVLFNGLAEAAPALVNMIVQIGLSILQAIIDLTPKLCETIVTVLSTLAGVIADNIGPFIVAAVKIVIAFIYGLAESMGMIVQAGVDLIVALVNGIAQGIRDNTEKIWAAVRNLLSSLVEFIINTLGDLLGNIPVVGKDLKNAMNDAAKSVQGFIAPESVKEETEAAMNGAAEGVSSGRGALEEEAKASGRGVTDSFAEGLGLDEVLSDETMGMIENLSSGNLDGSIGDLTSGINDKLGTGVDMGSVAGDWMGNLGTEITENSPVALDSVDGLIEDMGVDLDEFVDTGNDYGFDLDENFSDGIIEDAGTVSDAVTVMTSDAQQPLDDFAGDAEVAGKNATIGFVDGVLSKLPDVQAAMQTLGFWAKEYLRQELDEHSPSKEMARIGMFGGQGLANGFIQTLGTVRAAASQVGTSALDGIRDSISGIPAALVDLGDLNPTITPVMDLSNIQNGADTINGMFANTTLGVGGIQGDIFGGNLRSLAALAGSLSMDRGTGSADVVNAIAALQDEVATMGEKMSKLQVRMDSGALVGQIAAPLDASLGRIARRRERSG